MAAKWLHVGNTRKSNKFRCPVCDRIAYYPQNCYRNDGVSRIDYAYCPNCGQEMQPGEAIEPKWEEDAHGDLD